jgi:hypothetical protein
MAEPTALKPNADLPELASKIREHHKLIEDAGRNLLLNAFTAGRALLEAKRHPQVPHGKWLPWLKENCGLSERTANRYMKLANNRSKIEEKLKSKSATMADLALTQAERLADDADDKDQLGPLGKYDKASVALIKKLGELLPEDVEVAARRTIAELQAAVAAVKPAKAA